MRHIVTDRVAWSLCLLVCHSCEPLNQLRCHLGCGHGLAQGTMYYIGVTMPMGRGNFEAEGVDHCEVYGHCGELCENGWTIFSLQPVQRHSRSVFSVFWCFVKCDKRWFGVGVYVCTLCVGLCRYRCAVVQSTVIHQDVVFSASFRALFWPSLECVSLHLPRQSPTIHTHTVPGICACLYPSFSYCPTKDSDSKVWHCC